MPITTADKILDVAKEGLSLWKTFIATRQEAYNRQQDKKQVAAIDYAEKGIFEVDGLIADFQKKYPSAKKDKEIQGFIKKFLHFRRKFFKFH